MNFVSASAIQHHIRYSVWATNRLLEQSHQLSVHDLERDFGTADRTILGTLNHLFRSELAWLDRILHAVPNPAGQLDLESLSMGWQTLNSKWIAWSESLSDEDSERLFTYADSKGRPWTEPLWQIVFHVVNHSTHHRGQVSGFLRGLGKTPPPLDFIAFVRENART